MKNNKLAVGGYKYFAWAAFLFLFFGLVWSIYNTVKVSSADQNSTAVAEKLQTKAKTYAMVCDSNFPDHVTTAFEPTQYSSASRYSSSGEILPITETHLYCYLRDFNAVAPYNEATEQELRASGGFIAKRNKFPCPSNPLEKCPELDEFNRTLKFGILKLVVF
jgi:hypothetical protein